MEKVKIRVLVEVIQTEDGRTLVHYDLNENGSTMIEVALLVYKLKQLEQDFTDREWDGEGYEITDDGEDDYIDEEWE